MSPAEILDAVTQRAARLGLTLIGLDEPTSRFWLHCPDGSIRLGYAWKGIDRASLVCVLNDWKMLASYRAS